MKKYIILIPIYNDRESLTKLIENINSEIESINSEISVVVINDASSQQIIDKYTNTITQQKIEYERDQKEAILNSVIDFLVLSDCRFILGTHYSSFSDEACFMNLICKYCMSSHLSSLGYHTYGYDQKLNMILPNPLVKRYLKFIE